MRPLSKALIVILVLALFAGCASQAAYQAAIITATEADKQFLQTGLLYDQLAAAGKVTRDEYAAWAVFAVRYKVVSDQAYRTLKAAKDSKDVASTVALVQSMATELTLFYAYGLQKGGS